MPLVLLLLGLAVPPQALAQGDDDPERSRVDVAQGDGDELDPSRLEVAGFPALSFSSDTGFAFGIIGSMTRYEPDKYPYDWKLNAMAVVTLRNREEQGLDTPRQKHYLELNLPQFPTRRMRVRARLDFEWLKLHGYYGLGNDSPRLSELPDIYHQYEKMAPEAEIEVRYRLVSALSWFGRLRTGAQLVTVYEGSKLQADLQGAGGEKVEARLQGFGNHDHTVFRTGLLWDTRDHEEVPTSGMFHEASLRVGGSGYAGLAYGGANLTTRFYIPVVAPYLVIAQRTTADLLFGEPPFYELTYFGDWDVIRGIPIGRFAGKIRLMANFELRSRFAEVTVWGQRLNFGVLAFTDIGRVFTDYANLPELDGDSVGLKLGVGGGLRIQWGEGFVARADVAWSPDADDLGIYVGVGHAF